jgi:hypothetical protein
MAGQRAFVGIVYTLLGASFLAASGLLIEEFRASDPLAIVAAHSHLFLFFPVFGVLALAAFYLPSVVFTHLYWRHVAYGKLRLLIGLAVVAGLSYAIARLVDAPPRAVWEVSPSALAGDQEACGRAGSSCGRVPIVTALAEVRVRARERLGLGKFARNCKVDELLDPPEEMAKMRWCFPAGEMLDGNACCAVQSRFAAAVAGMQAEPERRSRAALLDAVFMPLRIFFVLILVAIGGLLAVWRHKLDTHYAELIPDIERGIIVGAIAMLFWPLMDYAYQQVANALFGRSVGMQFRLSLVIAPWALLLLFYFLRHLGAYSAIVAQISGVVVAAVYVLRYEGLNDWAVRLLGIGMDAVTVAIVVLTAFAGFACLLMPRRRARPSPSATSP